MGLLVSSLGPLLPGLQDRFGTGPTAAGVLVAAVPLGGLAGVLLSFVLVDRVPVRALLTGCCAAMAAGMAGTALAPAWLLLVASGVLVGVGYGGATTLVNGMVAAVYGASSTFLLNVLNGVFGVGAVLGPLCVAALPDGSQRLVYLGYAAVMATAPLLLARLPAGTPTTAPRPAGGPGVRVPPVRLAAFALLFAAYVALEVATGSWITSHLLGVDVDPAAAVRATSVFYAGLATGRLLLAPLGLRTGPGPLLLVASVCACAALLAVWTVPMDGWGYAAVGFAMGPVFPTGLAWVSQDLSAARHGIGLMVVASNAGGLLLPPAVGALVERAGAASAPLPLAGAAAVCAVMVAALLLSGRSRGAGAATVGSVPVPR